MRVNDIPCDFADRAGRRYGIDGTRWRGDDGSPLTIVAPRGVRSESDVSPIRGLRPDEIDANEWSLWRYASALPVDASQRVSLGEGMTPLVPVRLPSADAVGGVVHAKLEWQNPTSSFKDRGVSLLVSHLRAHGATHVLEDSSGNGGSSVAAYAAAAGLRATIVVPAATSTAKIMQMRAFGAEIELVEGTRDEVAAYAVRRSEEIPYASHNWHPMFLQGVKTIGYELWEQLGFTAPDNIVTVAGAGSIVLGCDLAFNELLAAGQIAKLPRLLVGQPSDWATIVEGVNGVERSPELPRQRSIAEGSSIASPVRLPEVVDAIRRSGGAGVAVSEDEIRRALRELVARGLYAEPTSAVAAAALARFVADGTIRPGETTVVVLTGTGLKSAAAMEDVFGDR